MKTVYDAIKGMGPLIQRVENDYKIKMATVAKKMKMWCATCNYSAGNPELRKC